jgi:hypothetical protein
MYKEENNNDPTREFKEDEMEKDARGEISVDELCARYREWWKVNYSGEKLVATKKVIINSFTAILGAVDESITRGGIKRRVFKGYSWGRSTAVEPIEEEQPHHSVVKPKLTNKSKAVNPML